MSLRYMYGTSKRNWCSKLEMCFKLNSEFVKLDLSLTEGEKEDEGEVDVSSCFLIKDLLLPLCEEEGIGMSGSIDYPGSDN